MSTNILNYALDYTIITVSSDFIEEEEKMEKEKFGTKLGFILATAGSAVGLGNIWRFPYLAAQYGGGFFLLVYIIAALTFGFSLMLTELAIGRKTGKSVANAYTEMNKKFSFLGVFAAIVPILVTPYYCVIGGWVIKYFVTFVSGHGIDATGNGEFFSGFIGKCASPTIYFLIFVLLTSAIVISGVQKGIEKLSKFMMPFLIALTLIIAIYTITRKGALEGVKYYLLPNFKDFSYNKLIKTIVGATGQLFYSMSIAMGILVTYGSYMRKEDSIEKSARQIGFFDTAIAFLSGLIIIPAAFAFSNGDTSSNGPGLMFITLPNVFMAMPGGQVIGSLFFLLVILAALTSSISLLETVASIISERFNLTRVQSSLISTASIIVLGMLSVLGYSNWSAVKLFGMQFLDFFDFITNNLIMPIVAFITCILVGYVVKIKFIEDEVTLGGKPFKARGMYRIMVRLICPACMILILLGSFISDLQA